MMIDFKVDDKEYKVVKPNAKQQSEANRIYAEEFSRLLKENKLMVREEMMAIAKSRGLWSEEKEMELEAMRQEIFTLQDKIEGGGYELDEAIKDANTIKELRTKILTSHIILNGVLNNTVEQQAEDARMDYLSSVCIVNGDGTPYFNSVDDLNTKEGEVVTEGLKKFNEMMYGSFDSFKDTPENKLLKEYAKEEEKEESKKKESKPFLKNGKPIKK